MESQEILLQQLIERAREHGLRPATAWESQNLDPRELFKSTFGGPCFVRDEAAQQGHEADVPLFVEFEHHI